jgi:hypothetical protein
LRHLGLAAGALVCLLGYTPAPGMAQQDVVALRAYQPTNFFVMHHDFTGRADALKSTQDARDTRVEIVAGLADPKCISLRTVSPPDHYYKQAFFRIVLAKRLDEPRFREDATFCIEAGLEKAVLAEARNRAAAFANVKRNATGGANGAGTLNGTGAANGNAKPISIRSYNYPDRFIRHRHGELWLDRRADTPDYRTSATFFIVPAAQYAE